MKKHIVLFFGLWSFVFSGYSQTLNLNHFGIEEGLPQSGIQTLTQDKSGSIWIGTLAGVSKYNGISFENYDKKNGLSENRIVSSLTDNNGNIWFGHWAGGISVYLSKQKVFKEIIPSKTEEIFKTINCIYQDKSGTFWFGTNGQGILRYVPNAKDFITSDTILEIEQITLISSKDGLSSSFVNAIIESDDNKLMIGTDQGICFIDTKTQKIASNNSLNALVPTSGISSLLKDSKGNIWVGTVNDGLTKINLKNNTRRKYTNADGLTSNNIKVIYETDTKYIFIGTLGGGVSKYLPQLEANNYSGSLFQTISSNQGLSNDKVLSIIQDREKNIWIGTYLNLNQYFDEQFEIYGQSEGLVNSLVWSIMQDKKGSYWLGTEGGLIRFDQGKNKNQNTFTNYSNSFKGLVTNTTALYEDKDGFIWYSNFGNGVSRLNPVTRQTQTFNTTNGLTTNDVYCITGDASGDVWIGTNKGGASKYSLQTNQFQHFSEKEGLGGDQVYTIYKDKKNLLWFGMIGGKLASYDGKSFKTYGKEQGYDNKFTLCITEDLDGNLWLGSYDNGIYKFDGKKFKNFGIKQGATSENAFLLVCDNKNSLWVGTRLGIDKFNIKEETFKHYGKQDGFLGIEINPNSVCKDQSGNLLFGSIIGLVKYNAENERLNDIEPITFLKSPRIFYKDFKIPENHEFSYFDNHFTFDFVGASLTNPKRVKYQYILEGHESAWSPIKKDNYVTFSNLPPGKYTFKVIACNNDGLWNKTPQEFSFTILPPFWQSTWFISMVIVFLGLVTISYVKVREKKLRKENKILEDKVSSRTLELRNEKENVERQNVEIEQQKNQLQKTNEQITDSIDYAKRIQEAVFVPLESIADAFPKSFVFFKPKAIVSGDFYWMHKTNTKLLFAAADCTGHGVPGAFMSIIGYNLLNTIIKEQGLTSPAEILTELNKQIILTLNQSEHNTKVKDGMDVALCCYDVLTGKLDYAGANNPLYLVRNNQLSEVKADRFSLGKSPLHEELIFTNNTITVEKGDSIYIFTDGFVDQKGGPNNKKFFYPPFRQLLESNSTLPFDRQRDILDKTIEDWKAGKEQIDDILVMGISF